MRENSSNTPAAGVQWSLGYPVSTGPGHSRIPETTGYAKQHYNHSVLLLYHDIVTQMQILVLVSPFFSIAFTQITVFSSWQRPSRDRGVGQDHVRRYFADSSRRNVHESAFIKDQGISGDTEEMVYTL